ncbi:MAG: hypothetical protein H6733_08195 [Alphaproteobacteria bacterium]|nr:hypothetical protein [Alphaproteobacteria bacterium]
MRDELEQMIQSVARGGDWLGNAAGVVATDLADDSHLGDLLDAAEPDEDTVQFLRSSRLPRLRPILVVLAARASGGGEVDPELQYAAELLYAALAVHDAAIGPRHNKRRTLARRMLRGVGWMGSNRTLLRAMELVRHAPSPEVMGDLIDTLSAFHDGEEVAAAVREGRVPDIAAWQEHADGQIGAIFGFCCRVGAHVAGVGAGQLSAFSRFGKHLGRMWHVAEDVVLLGDTQGVEYLGGRALAGRPMLPVAVAVERDPTLAASWQRLVTEHDAEAAAAMFAGLRATRAVHGTREWMAREHWAARQALTRFEPSPYRHALERLASGLARAPYEDRAPELPSYVDADER